METFAPPRPLIDHPHFERERRNALRDLSSAEIDVPMRGIVDGLARRPCCFTLQSCCGHFVHPGARTPDNLEPLPRVDVGVVTYRIAYLALCVQDSPSGHRLLSRLAEIPSIDPELIQFGSPGWFWGRHVNSYAVQVMPSRFAQHDQAAIDHAEALRIEEARDRFLERLDDLAGSRDQR
jgi:hypothetical protein